MIFQDMSADVSKLTAMSFVPSKEGDFVKELCTCCFVAALLHNLRHYVRISQF